MLLFWMLHPTPPHTQGRKRNGEAGKGGKVWKLMAESVHSNPCGKGQKHGGRECLYLKDNLSVSC